MSYVGLNFPQSRVAMELARDRGRRASHSAVSRSPEHVCAGYGFPHRLRAGRRGRARASRPRPASPDDYPIRNALPAFLRPRSAQKERNAHCWDQQHPSRLDP